ncbi:toast rack family protein [Schinkia sp. CFF1]
MKKRYLGVMIVAVTSVLLLASCSGVKVGDLQSDHASFKLHDEKSLDVSVRLGAGDTTIDGNTSKAAEADFSYNVEKLKPVVDYQISNKKGQLSIYQSNMNVPVGKIENLKYETSISLNNTLPTKLYVKTGAGSNRIDLRPLKLTGVEIFSGVGQTTINMAGDYQKSFDANIESGMGNTKIIVPKHVGAKILVDSGVGKVETEGLIQQNKEIYVNGAFDKAKVKINIKIKMGVGDLKIVQGE